MKSCRATGDKKNVEGTNQPSQLRASGELVQPPGALRFLGVVMVKDILTRLKKRISKERLRYRRLYLDTTAGTYTRERAYGETTVLQMAQRFVEDELKGLPEGSLVVIHVPSTTSVTALSQDLGELGRKYPHLTIYGPEKTRAKAK